MIFIDSNIPMYMVGRDPAFRERTRAALQKLMEQDHLFCTSAEVFQEILHRFTMLRRHGDIHGAYDFLAQLVVRVLPVDLQCVMLARDFALSYPDASARDCLHAASMRLAQVKQILTFDRDFDRFPGIQRIPLD